MLERSKYGILYSTATKGTPSKTKKLLESEGYKDTYYFWKLFLNFLLCEEYELLNKEIMPYTIISKNKTRLENIFTYVEHHYDKEINIEDVAKLANLTLPAFCNFLRRQHRSLLQNLSTVTVLVKPAF